MYLPIGGRVCVSVRLYQCFGIRSESDQQIDPGFKVGTGPGYTLGPFYT